MTDIDRPPDGILEAAEALAASAGPGSRGLLPVLQGLQERFGWVPDPAVRRAASGLGIPAAEAAGVATFYARFRRRPAGRHTLSVCVGTACHVRGSTLVAEAFRRALRIPPGGDTDAGRLFTIEEVACLGCCMLAPVVRIDDVIYGPVNPAAAPRILRDFLASREAPVAETPPGPGAAVPAEVRVCLCSSCRAAGSGRVRDAFLRCIAEGGAPAAVRAVGCTGLSHLAPLVEIALPGGPRFRYGRVRPRDAAPILLRHFPPAGLARRARAAAGLYLEGLLEGEAQGPEPRFAVDLRDAPAAAEDRQVRIATEGAGGLDPLDLEGYARAGGFEALRLCLAEADPEAVIRRIEASGLRGRGGAGFPTGRKWRAVRETPGGPKVVIGNGDEGDPGAFMDRMILESFPFRVLEGTAVAAFAVGAPEAVLYVRTEYPLALRRLREAIRVLEDRGVLRRPSSSSSSSSSPSSSPPSPLDALPHAGVSVRVVEGAGAFVCGEETALLAALEGRRGNPRFRPPYPASSGLEGRPTLVNNVETLALVPWILRRGPSAFAALGTAGSKGTKTFALAGKVLRGGLIEVPMGMTLREIVEGIGGGCRDGRKLKAVQVGGPSGGCVPASLADTPVDYEALLSAGAFMGSGGMVVLDEADCMVDVARYFLRFTQAESCGKCPACRVGTRRMLDVLDRLCGGKGRPEDLAELERLARAVRRGSLCGLGKSAPNPVLSTLRHFRAEIEAHAEGRCPAGRCRGLIRYSVGEECIGCTRCAQHCPADAIAMRPYERHEIDPSKCIRCGTCAQVCPEGAVRAGPNSAEKPGSGPGGPRA